MTVIDTCPDQGIITTEAAANVLWLFDYEGYAPGGFKTALYSTIAKADPANRAKLAGVFPTEVAAYRLAHDHEDGIEILRLIAKGDAR